MEHSSESDVDPPGSVFPAEGVSEQSDGRTDGGPIGFLIVDDSLTVTGSSDVSELLPRETGTVVGESLDTLFFSDFSAISDAVREAFQSGEAVKTDVATDRSRRLTASATPMSEIVVVQLCDVPAYTRLTRELKRSRKILDTLDDGIYTLDEAFVITSVNHAVSEITGYSRDELVGAHASILAGDETIAMATAILEQLRNDESDVGLIESSIQTADGESLPIETRFSTVEFADGGKRRVGLLRDVTVRRRHEHTLQKLNQSARQLLRADDEQGVCETIVDVAMSLWPDAAVAVYRFDQSGPHLETGAASGTDPENKAPGTPEWEAFATGRSGVKEAESSDSSSSETPEGVSEDDSMKPSGRVIESTTSDEKSTQTLFASLEEHGLLTIEFGPERNANDVNESVEIIAANAVAALGRVEREAELSRRQAELVARNDRLERVHEFNDLLRRINGILVDATTLDDIATAVCDHLVGAEHIAFAWFGEIYRSSGGLEPVARAGAADGYLDELDTLGTDPVNMTTEANTAPAGRALAGQEPVVVSDISTDLGGSQWAERPLVRGFQSAISVPIAYNDLTYGVLSVYADRQGEFDDSLGELLTELGETIGNAINGLETKRSLRSRSRIELKLRIADPETLSSRLAATLGESVVVEGAVPDTEGRSVLYLQTDGDPTQLASSVIAVEDVRSLDGSDQSRAAVTITGDTLVDQLTDYGADIKHFRAESNEVEVTLVLAKSVDVRGFIDALKRRYSAVELLARRDWTAPEDGELSTAARDRLTDRQHEVVETAYLNGYFEWPRDSTGEEVAKSLDITQPTFNRHLRTTERTLFSLLFGDSE